MSCRVCGYDELKQHKWPRVAGVQHCPSCDSEVDGGRDRREKENRPKRRAEDLHEAYSE
jgi:hypothetical protein